MSRISSSMVLYACKWQWNSKTLKEKCTKGPSLQTTLENRCLHSNICWIWLQLRLSKTKINYSTAQARIKKPVLGFLMKSTNTSKPRRMKSWYPVISTLTFQLAQISLSRFSKWAIQNMISVIQSKLSTGWHNPSFSTKKTPRTATSTQVLKVSSSLDALKCLLSSWAGKLSILTLFNTSRIKDFN